MISSLVFWIELSESPNLVPDSSLKPGKWKGNGRKAKWKNSTGWIETSSRWWKMMILPPTTCKCFLCASNKQDIVRMHPISSTTIEIFRKFVLKAECSHTSRIFLELILPWEKWEPGCFFFIVSACQSHCRRGLVRITGVRGKQSSKELSSSDGSIEMTSGPGGEWKESKMLVNLEIPLFLLKSCATLQTTNSIDFAPWV